MKKTVAWAFIAGMLLSTGSMSAQDFRFERQSSEVSVEGLYGYDVDEDAALWVDDSYAANAAGYTNTTIDSSAVVNAGDQVLSNGSILSAFLVSAGGEGAGFYPWTVARNITEVEAEDKLVDATETSTEPQDISMSYSVDWAEGTSGIGFDPNTYVYRSAGGDIRIGDGYSADSISVGGTNGGYITGYVIIGYNWDYVSSTVPLSAVNGSFEAAGTSVNVPIGTTCTFYAYEDHEVSSGNLAPINSYSSWVDLDVFDTVVSYVVEEE